MKFSVNGLRMRKKGMSVFLSSVLALNTIAMINVKVNGSSTVDAKTIRSNITTNALSYIKSQKNGNGSYGDSSLVNDTSDALIAVRSVGENISEDSVKWMTDTIEFDNTDMLSRLSAATGNPEYLSQLGVKQNPDGGFGLYPEYSSDVLDSVLILEALNDTNYHADNISGIAICNFLINSVNTDGGFSYTKASDSDDILTSMVIYNAGRYLSANNYDLSVLDAPLSYIEKSIADDYTDNGIRKTIWKYLAMQPFDVETDYIDLLNKLEKAEKSDGSFAEDIETTSAAIRLLNGIDLENKLNVLSFETTLSNNKASTGKSSTISGITSIGYTTNIDATLDLKITVYSGEAAAYENSSKVTCKADENTIKVNSCDFKLAEPDGSEVYLLAELYDNDKLLRVQRINIDLASSEQKYSTEITDISINLDQRAILKDSSPEVDINYDLLYATNVENSAQIKTIVTKDGKEVDSAIEDVSLVPEQNHIKKKALTFKPDTSETGKYDISVSCIFKGNEIVRNITSFEVVEQPVIVKKMEGNSDSQFAVYCFEPVLSDYLAYAGNTTEIETGVVINYHVNDVFRGNIELSVFDKDKVIAETSFEAVLEKGEEVHTETLTQFPTYMSGNKLSFNVMNTGEYIVKAKLFDTEGNLIQEATRTMKVIDRPKQDLILNSSVSDEKPDMIDLSWNDISNDTESYNYQLYRKTDNGKWEPRSIWNEEEHIKLLSVYPFQPYLAEWLTTTISDTETPAGKGIFDIDSIHFADFNEDPVKYLYNEDGSWKFDVICFGFGDYNGYFDLSDNALDEVQKFIDSGRGILFGHDTLARTSEIDHLNFNKIAKQAGLMIGALNGNMTTSVSVVKTGTLTNYPWVIRGTLNVPVTHGTSQYIVDANVWIELNIPKYVDPETGYTEGFYLSTKNNLGMIQTGHSTGQATDDERKVLANTLFYLYQISQQTTAKDASFYDITAPDAPTVISSKNEKGKAVINVRSADNATEYEYYISANPTNEKSESVLSNIKKHTALSGLAGFVVKLAPSSEPNPELIEYDETKDNILGIVPADKNGKAVLEAVPTDFSQQQYIHIFAVDKANNVSEEYIIPFADSELNTSIDTDKKIYSNGEKIIINTNTRSSNFGRKADMSISIYDESDNKIIDLISEKNKVLEPDAESAINSEWVIPFGAVGRFKAEINWYNDDEVVAEAESVFRIENEQSISNFIASDKKSYSVNEPINVTGDVYNNSKAMTENDLVVNIKLYNSANKEVMAFEHNVGALNPDAFADHSDAIAPGKLKGGNYLAKAVVMQDDIEISSDTAEFTVNDTPSFSGKLDLSPVDGKGKADFTIKNLGGNGADAIDVTVKVYKADTNELVHTYTYPTAIKAGETITGKTEFILDEGYDGDYSAVLSAAYNNTSVDLDYDGFKQIKKAVETTAAAASTTTTTTAAKSDSPKTGDSGIPAYMWMISILSLTGIIILRKTGGSEENE